MLGLQLQWNGFFLHRCFWRYISSMLLHFVTMSVSSSFNRHPPDFIMMGAFVPSTDVANISIYNGWWSSTPVPNGRYPELMISIPCVVRMDCICFVHLEWVAGANSGLYYDSYEASLRPNDCRYYVNYSNQTSIFQYPISTMLSPSSFHILTSVTRSMRKTDLGSLILSYFIRYRACWRYMNRSSESAQGRCCFEVHSLS